MEIKNLMWRKSSYSSNGGGNCVEAANADHVHVRDSQDQDGPRLEISSETWHTFTRRIKAS
jgi:hypothetical protein